MNATFDNVEAARSDLALEALRRTGRLRLRAHGESMLPTLWPGDEVEVVSCSRENVQPGEIVLARREGRVFLHRLISCEESGRFVLRGDSMAAADSAYESAALAGKLVGVMRRGRMAALRPRAWARPVGWMLCHCGPVRRLALRIQCSRSFSASFRLTGARDAHEYSS